MAEQYVLEILMLKKFLKLIEKYNVTHFGGAPIVLNMITGAPEEIPKKLKQKVMS